MIEKQETLVQRLKNHLLAGPSFAPLNPPATAAEFAHAEALLKFALPPLLKDIYLEVGNGGFGPGYGLFPLYNEEDPDAMSSSSLVTTYLALRSLTPEQFTQDWVDGDESDKNRPRIWPEQVLMICDWGCNSYSYLDCSTDEYRVLHVDHNTYVRKFSGESPSFSQWLEDWLEKQENGEP